MLRTSKPTQIQRTFSSLIQKVSPHLQIDQLNLVIYKRLKSAAEIYKDASNRFMKGVEDEQESAQLRAVMFENEFLYKQFEDIEQSFNNIAECQEMLDEYKKDPDLLKMLQEETKLGQHKLAELKDHVIEYILDPELYDDCEGAMLEFRPGVGGNESALFCDEIYHTYKNFCGGQGWRVSELNYTTDPNFKRGLKYAKLEVTGEDSFKMLKCESGVHK